MSITDTAVDTNLYSIYISDASVRTKNMLDTLTTQKLESLSDEQLSDFNKHITAITSAANLCRIPGIADLCSAFSNSVLLVIQKNITPDSSLHTIFVETLTHLEVLNKTSVDNISLWYEENYPHIQNSLSQLKSLSSSPVDSSVSDSSVKPHSITQPPATNSIKTLKIDSTIYDLFQVEARTQASTMNEHLLILEEDPHNNSLLEPLMRAAHSIKGAARMVGLDNIVSLAHHMEDCFVNCQGGKINIDKLAVDLLLTCNDILADMARIDHAQLSQWMASNQTIFEAKLESLKQLAAHGHYTPDTVSTLTPANSTNGRQDSAREAHHNQDSQPSSPSTSRDNLIRIPSERLNKILAVSNELLMSQHWINGHMGSLQLLKKRQTELASLMTKIKQKLEDLEIPDDIYSDLIDTENKIDDCRRNLHENISHLEDYDRKTYVLSSKLNQEVVASRMRPFSECTYGFKRMVRDISKSLSKDVRLHIEGMDTLVDSDILEMIEAPLTHLLRNAIDHGIETVEERIQREKTPQGNIHLTAMHHAGKLSITIADDGKGVDSVKLKNDIIDKGMVNRQMAEQLTESELLDFLFLPGFSTRTDVTEYSGRGVGLDIVHDMTTSLHGQIKSSSRPGKGLSIELQLPLTLSIIHALLFELGNEYYAIPLVKIHAVIKKTASEISTLENKQLIKFDNNDISLLNGSDLLECHTAEVKSDILDIIVLNDKGECYAIVVDKIVSEARLALLPVDARLGKIRDISAAAIADDGRPVLVLDIDDLLINIQAMTGSGKLGSVSRCYLQNTHKNLKKILVIDDSLTVREVEKNLLESKGYSVDLAVDGMDGWNTFKSGSYDLVITDIDMPRMNGIELVEMIKSDTHTSNTPVMIVSYKDNPDDRLKGLEAGADYYLTKGSFHDESLIDAVVDLIGEAKV